MTVTFTAYPRESNEGAFRRHFLLDRSHKSSRRFSSQGSGIQPLARPQSIVTTDEVLTELLTFSAADQQLRTEASLVVNDVLGDKNVRVVPQTRRSFLAGFALHQARPDKGYSLTDCISMATMRHSGLTNDRHFEQEGFHALFRDS